MISLCPSGIFLIVLSISSSVHCVPLALPSTTTSSFAFPPPSVSWANKKLLSNLDLKQSYEMHSKDAVGKGFDLIKNFQNQNTRSLNENTRNSPQREDQLNPGPQLNPHPQLNPGPQLNPRPQLNSGPQQKDQLLFSSNEEDKTLLPIGSYEYTDTYGDLHIVNYVNGRFGLKILNDYTPYKPLRAIHHVHHTHTFKSQSQDEIKPQETLINENKGKIELQTQSVPNLQASSSANKHVDWDEYEFTFNAAANPVSAKVDTKRLDAKQEPKNNVKDIETSSTTQRNQPPANSIKDLLKVVTNSIPLPQPFSPLRADSPPFFLQKNQDDNHWRGPPIAQSILYGIPLKDSAADLGPQPFPPFFNWDPVHTNANNENNNKNNNKNNNQ